jgi:hypothetical protein
MSNSFGTRGSQVRILPLRPIRHRNGTETPPEVAALLAWIRKQRFSSPEARSRAACLSSNIKHIESSPAARQLIAADLALLQASANVDHPLRHSRTQTRGL